MIKPVYKATGPKVAIVGAEAAKFTTETGQIARSLCNYLINDSSLVISGGCHLGGIDIWAEEAALNVGIPTLIHKPKNYDWNTGYKTRNIKIAEDCDVLYNITVAEYPPLFHGKRFASCYHCGGMTNHVKSGGCWTAHYARRLGKLFVYWLVIDDEGWRPFTPQGR